MMRLPLALAVALAGSALLHAAGLMILPAARHAELAGGEAAAPPLQGDSFADLSEGMAQPVAAAAAVVTPRRPDLVADVAPDSAAAPVPPARAWPAETPAAASAAAPDVAVPVARVTAASSVPSAGTAAVSPREAIRARPEPARASPAAPPVAPRPDEVARPVRKPAVAQGGDRAARKGATSGSDAGTSAKATGRQQTQDAGGPAASAAYGSAVMRRISGTRKRSTSLRGAAVIAFSIGAGGQLVSVSVARSSGSAELDALGIDHIRRAAPFPAPPAGVSARFSVEFKGR